MACNLKEEVRMAKTSARNTYEIIVYFSTLKLRN